MNRCEQPECDRPQAIVRWAATDRERRDLYRLRAKVFLGEGIIHGDARPELFDLYDCYRSTRNVVAVQPGPNGADKVIGGCRVTLPTPGLAILDTPLFDFAPAVGGHAPTAALGSMLCVDPDVRGHHDIARRVIATALAEGLTPEITAVCSAVRPMLVSFLERLGWRTLGPGFDHDVEQVPVVPMWLELRPPGSVRVDGDGRRNRHRIRRGHVQQ